MKTYILTVAAIFLISCNDIIETTGDKIINQTSIGLLGLSKEEIITPTHNLDSGIIEFTLEKVDRDILNHLENKAVKNGWCVSKNNFDEMVFLVLGKKENEVIRITYIFEEKRLYFNVSH